jgi:hypothetical protein
LCNISVPQTASSTTPAPTIHAPLNISSPGRHSAGS